ncbi:zinc finger MYM-type protein 1-like [Metopolophium dirhodum]|uniref:zinc finger MYM-type protein 1-like n=1 Tax=Metopolophium dirhodum TaxID=44670 RepID=UPI00298FDD76|nr:zinc finger MYM-type protein 1-like [Metopolophium dirhodum]
MVIKMCNEIYFRCYSPHNTSPEPVNTDISQTSTSSTSSKNTAISEQNVIDPRNNDIGLFVNANGSLTDEQKHLLKNGAFCKFCLVFATTGGVGQQQLGALTNKAFTNWKNAKEKFNEHASFDYHNLSVTKAEGFLSIYSNKTPSIITALDNDRVKLIKQNRDKLIPIIECILLCGYQEIPLRGSFDFGPINFKNSTHNEGNFRAILKYKAKDCEFLKSHLESDTKSKYLSPQIQNEIITICGDILIKKLVDKVNESKCFLAMADETTDVLVSEQLTICVRYLSGTGSNIEINEDFLKFYEISSLTGKDLASSILNGLNSCGLDCLDCDFLYGQGYDGAANMAGQFKGAQTIIRSKHPKALYVHCAAHSLNLAVSSACNMQSMRNCLGIIEKYYCFFNFPKRNNELLEVINNDDWEPKVKTLKRLCMTRWVQRYDAINDFIELFPCVTTAHSNISEWNDSSSTDTNMMLKAIDLQFLVSLQVIKVLFSFALPLCKQLQRKNIDLKEMVNLPSTSMTVLENLRKNVENEFKKMFKEAQVNARYLF